METKYYVDQRGNYLGGFSGTITIEHIAEQHLILNEDGTPSLDENKEPVYGELITMREVRHEPIIPDGVILIDGPPDHGWQKYDLKKNIWLPLTEEQNRMLEE